MGLCSWVKVDGEAVTRAAMRIALPWSTLAQRAGIGINTLIRARQGKRLHMMKLAKLADALNVSIDDLRAV